jgi:hypothetical protein
MLPEDFSPMGASPSISNKVDVYDNASDPGQLQLWPMQEPILEQLWLTTKYSGSAVMIFPALQTK